MSDRPEMTSLQALLTGAVAGCLMRAGELDFDVEISTDEHGYLPVVVVKGRQSGEVCRITVETSDASPDTVRDWDMIEMAVKNTIGNSDRVNGLAALKRLRGDEEEA